MAINRPYLRCANCTERDKVFSLSECIDCDITKPEKNHYTKDENIIKDEDE